MFGPISTFNYSSPCLYCCCVSISAEVKILRFTSYNKWGFFFKSLFTSIPIRCVQLPESLALSSSSWFGNRAARSGALHGAQYMTPPAQPLSFSSCLPPVRVVRSEWLASKFSSPFLDLQFISTAVAGLVLLAVVLWGVGVSLPPQLFSFKFPGLKPCNKSMPMGNSHNSCLKVSEEGSHQTDRSKICKGFWLRTQKKQDFRSTQQCFNSQLHLQDRA